MHARQLLVLAVGILGTVTSAYAQDPRKEGWSFGATEFQARCAPCHGSDAKGGGPVAKQRFTVPDLTTYAKRNGGVFPTELAWQKIDGRPVAWDSKSMMPVWGQTFRHEMSTTPYPTKAPETYVAAEIKAILSYLETLQVK